MILIQFNWKNSIRILGFRNDSDVYLCYKYIKTRFKGATKLCQID